MGEEENLHLWKEPEEGETTALYPGECCLLELISQTSVLFLDRGRRCPKKEGSFSHLIVWANLVFQVTNYTP